MAIIQLTGFSGEIPRLLPRLLPEMAAQEAYNTRLTNGGLEPVREPAVEFTPEVEPVDDSTIYLHNGEWRIWPGLVHATPGPVAQDRLYYTGDGVPKMSVGGTDYNLAVDSPPTQLTATVSGTGDGEIVTRLYVYTHVTEFGEESEPSPITEDIEWESGQTVTLSGFELGDVARGVNRQRIYRSQTGPSGTQLYFIAERASATADYVDNVDVEDIGEPIPSTNWNAPPDDLEGVVSMPAGMMAAFVGKDLYFCEPYRPHAWPFQYVQTVDYPIVGLGSFGNSLLITTTGTPYVATGTAPESMQMQKLELNLPCLNPRGIVDLGYAVAYPSYEGLVVADNSGANVVTENLFARDDWEEIDPKSIVASQYDGRYFASYDYLDYRQQRRQGTFIIDLTGSQAFLIRTKVVGRAFHYDIKSGALYYLSDGVISRWDAPGQALGVQTWRSREFVMPSPTNFGAMLIDARSGLTDQETSSLESLAAAIQEENETLFNADESIGGDLNGAAINVYPVNGDMLKQVPSSDLDLTINVYGDGELRASVTRVNQMARLPAGFKASKWVIEVSGNMMVKHIALATTGQELRGV